MFYLKNIYFYYLKIYHKYIFHDRAVFLNEKEFSLWHRNSFWSYPAELPATEVIKHEAGKRTLFYAAQWEELALDVGQVRMNPEHIWLFSLKSFPK